MKRKVGIIYIGFRDVIMITTFVLALLLENARGERLWQMTILFAAFFAWLHLREVFLEKFQKLISYSFALDAVLLVMLDESSKYLVNYYFNVYYFYVLISAGFMLKKRSRLVVSFIIVSAAFIKYYRFIQAVFSESQPSNMTFIVSYIFFTFMVFITIAVFFNYSMILSEEKVKLDKLNCELIDANASLEEKNRRIKELTIFEERTRIAGEIHDSVGHNLTGLIMNLGFCEKLPEGDYTKLKTQITKSKEIAKECLAEIRRSVKALRPVLENHTLINSLQELINGSEEKFNMDINLKVIGEVYSTRPEFNAGVYRICQEAVTNSVRHGSASKMEIGISYGEKEFSIFIKDNGETAEHISPGTGLTGIKERVKIFNGNVNFSTDDGFIIDILVPVEGILNE